MVSKNVLKKEKTIVDRIRANPVLKPGIYGMALLIHVISFEIFY